MSTLTGNLLDITYSIFYENKNAPNHHILDQLDRLRVSLMQNNLSQDAGRLTLSHGNDIVNVFGGC